jgi:hypothetical protein
MIAAVQSTRRTAELSPVIEAFETAGLALPGIEAKAWIEKASEEPSSLDSAQIGGAAQ